MAQDAQVTVVLATSPHRDKHLLQQAVESIVTQGVDFCLLMNDWSVTDKWNWAIVVGWDTPYLCIAHDDDVFYPGFFAETADYLNAHPECPAVFTFYDELGESGEVQESYLPLAEQFEKEQYTLPELWRLTLNHRRLLHAPAGIYNIGATDWVRFNGKYGLAQDKDFVFRLAERGPIGVIRRPLYGYRTDSQSGVSWNILRKDKKQNTAWIEVLKDTATRNPEVLKGLSDEDRMLYSALLRVRDGVLEGRL